MNKILVCVGARPNLMKASSLFRAAKDFPKLRLDLLHTGQHYSTEMDKVFFDQLKIPAPNYQLQVGSASHAVMTAEVMKRFEPVLLENQYDLVVVIGDINSTVSCTLVAKKLDVPVAHVEAGLRSFDMKMPEEINRKVVDHISDYLFTTEKSGNENLKKEGIDDSKVFFVGNTMIDTLVHHLDIVKKTDVLKEHDLQPGHFAVLTLHRPSNVDNIDDLKKLLKSIVDNAPANLKIVFPVHPRTQKSLETIKDDFLKRFILISPQPYFSFMSLVYHSMYVLTDSGGIQEETTYLKKPCFTLRANTERPITTEIGSNFLINKNIDSIPELMKNFDPSKKKIPELWDGKTGHRILDHFMKF
jgi:UDP-N-acetylglucosamine 2-epimerase (non-hydrolysing)